MKERLLFFFLIAFLLLGVQNRFFESPHSLPNEPTISKTEAVFSTATTNAVITRVVDGDTVVANIDGILEKIRLIGVDTPETLDPRKPVQCFGKEASAFTRSLLEGKSVRLESDQSQGNRDKYGRLLRYVYIGETLVNEEIISEGYGHEYTYKLPYLHQAEFRNSENEARKHGKGLWATGVCVT